MNDHMKRNDKDPVAGLSDRMNDSSTADLPSDGAISGVENLQIGATENMQKSTTDTVQSPNTGHPPTSPYGVQQGGSHFQSGEHFVVDKTPGQSGQLFQQTGPHTQGPPRHDPPRYTPGDQDTYQYQVPPGSNPHQYPVQGNPQQFYQPYYDQSYRCWMYYDVQYGQWRTCPPPQYLPGETFPQQQQQWKTSDQSGHGQPEGTFDPNRQQYSEPSFQHGGNNQTWQNTQQLEDMKGQHVGQLADPGQSPDNLKPQEPRVADQFDTNAQPQEMQDSSQPASSPRRLDNVDQQGDPPLGAHPSKSMPAHQEHQPQYQPGPTFMSHQIPAEFPEGPPPPYREYDTQPVVQGQKQLQLERDQYEKERNLSMFGPVVEVEVNVEKTKEEQDSSEEYSATEHNLPEEGIEIKGLPNGVTEDTVSLYFENKRRSGGGAVKNVDIRGDGTAVVYFADSGVIERVLAQKSQKIQGRELQVSRYSPDMLKPLDHEAVEEQQAEHADTVVVRGCVGILDDMLEMYFEIAKKSGGGEVKKLTRTDDDEVIIIFHNLEVCERVLAQKSHKIQGKELQVSKYSPQIVKARETDDKQPEFTIVVRGCTDITDDVLEMYFESKKSGGGEVRKLTRTGRDEVVITFMDPEVVENILAKETHKVQGKVLEVTKYRPIVQKPSKGVEEGPADTILVIGCGEITDDMLEMYFESTKKSGGDDIKKLTRLSNRNEVIISFINPEVLDNVLKKESHKLANTEVQVSIYVPKKPETVPLPDEDVDEEEKPQDTICVKGCHDLSDDLMEMYFENKKKSGGGEIQRMERGEDADVTLITFSDPEVLEEVLKREHRVGGRDLEVTAYVPPRAKSSQLNWNANFEDYIEDDEDVDETEDDPSVYVLKVTGLKDNTSEETLTLYFENRRRSGGDQVEKVEVDVDSSTALVYFMEGNVVERVVQKVHHLEGRNLQVSPYLPSKTAQQGADGKAWLRESPEGTVIELHGSSQIKEDILQLYFENKKRSGGEAQDIRRMDEEEVIYIIYDSPEEAKRVADKQHFIDGNRLKASLYTPPPPPLPRPKYPDRFLIRGLKETTTKEVLLTFLREKCEIACKDNSLTYGDEPGTVLVAVGKRPLRIRRWKRICRKRPLEGAFLEISDVPVSNCILVKGLKQNASISALELYFESKRSGNDMGAEVEKCDHEEGSGQALVYFDNHKVIQKILQREHNLDKCSFSVSLYNECLGESGGDSDPCWFKLPEPVTLDSQSRYKIQFIRESPLNHKTFEDQLKDDFATVVWHENDTIILECMLKKEMKDSRKQIKTWKKDAVESAEHYMSMLVCEEMKILNSVWNDVIDGLQSLKMPKPDAGKMFVLDDDCLIVIVAHSSVSEGLIDKVKKIVKAVEEEQERKKSEISETVKTIKPLSLRYLLATGYPNDMMTQFQGLKIEIKLVKSAITFTGLLPDVKSAQIKMYERTNGLSTLSLSNMSQMQMKFVEKKEVRQYIVKKLKAKQLVGVWESEKSCVNILANTDKAVKSVVDILHQSVKEQMIDLDPESVPLLNSPEWRQIEQDLLQNRGEFLKIIPGASQTQIVIVGTDDIIAGAAEDINNFIREKTIYSETIQYPRGIQRFLTLHMENDIRSIAKDLKTYTVDILFLKTSLEFDIKGTTDGLKIAMAKLDELSDKISHKSHLFDKPGIGKLILSDKGKQYIGMIENTERCIVEREFDDRGKMVLGNRDAAHPTLATGGPQIMAAWKLGGGRTLHVSQGDITQMNVDVIVNAANAQLAHIGGLARAIVEKGGESIQRESHSIVKSHGDVMVGEVAVTNPGRLPCKIVVHAVGPIWSGGSSQEEELLREAIFNTLEETNKRKLKSVAIPALSTGIYRYPVPKATRVIVEAIQTHFQNFPNSQVQDVFVCDNNIKTVNQFMSAVEEKVGKAQVQKQSPRHGRATGGGYQHPAEAPKHYFSAPSPKQQRSNIQIKVVKGEIANQTVDAIVNTTAGNLVLTNGAVSKSILAAGGQILQQECSMNYPNGINIGEVAVTHGGNLNCRKVFHTCLPSWAPKVGEKAVELLTEECLKTAAQNGLTSVAFPALGTGNLGYPRDLVAKVMFETINSFGQQTTSVKEVRVVVYPSDVKTAKAFDQQSKGVVARGRTRQGRSFSKSDSSSSGSGAAAAAAAGGESTSDTDWHTVTAADLETVFSAGKVQLTIKQGDITKEQVNCIVNSTNSSLDLSQGAVARSILNAGGEDLMKDCDMRKEDMVRDGVVVTKAFGLRSDYIVHVNAHHFQDMKKVVLKCLKAAGKSKYVSSIAFPALGTGQGFATVEVMSQQLVEAIQEYQNSKSSGSIISDVRMVIYQKSMLGPFVDGVTNALKGVKKGFFRRAYDYLTGDGSSSSKTEISTEPIQLQAMSDVTLHFFSDDDYSVAKSIEKLETRCTDLLSDRKIEDEDLKNLQTEQKIEIEDLARRFSVRVDYQPRLGRVRLQGLSSDVSDASDALQKILRKIHRAEIEAEKAEMLASMVQWYFIETDNSGADQNMKYDAVSNQKIEDAYKSNKQFARLVDVNGQEYIIDFKKNVEYPENNKFDTLRVIRKDLIQSAAFEAPTTWSPMTKESEMMQLTPGTTEYSSVEQDFSQGTAGQHRVLKIQRIQTKFLWQQYVAKKQQINAQNPPGHTNERVLWHGTAADAIPSICKGGFNRSYCGKNATYYGEGVYFAVNSNYSAQGRYSPPDSHGQRHVFQARVLTGEYTQGKQGLRVLPMKDTQRYIQFDSTVENMANPTMFVIFNDTQAYPDYLVTFQ